MATKLATPAIPAGPPPRHLSLLIPGLLLPLSIGLIAHPVLSSLLHLPESRLPGPLSRLSDFPALEACFGFSGIAFLAAIYSVPALGDEFMRKGLKGRDMLKGIKGGFVPESMGLPCASIYIILLIIFIPLPFSHIFEASAGDVTSSSGKGASDMEHVVGKRAFPHHELALYLSALLSLLIATLLGFIDDVFDIRWRHKLPIPLVASIPLLLVYYAEEGLTTVVMPRLVRRWFGETVDLGPLYYLYMSLLSTFSTNSINILAGVNGIEVSQSLIIAISVAVNDLLYIPIWPRIVFGEDGVPGKELVLLEGGALLRRGSQELVQRHLMSFYFMLPLIGVCAGFLFHNWYPARAFPGDTFCYFSGMAFAVVAIQGHFSKTLLLFFLPQIFNFVLSCPQLFGLVACPRHRLPKFDESTGLLLPSRTVFERPPPLRTRLVLRLLEALCLCDVERDPQTGTIKSSTNLTIITVILVHFGPMHEATLTKCVMALQVAGSVAAFAVRYGLAQVLYDGDRR